ncbi:carotenoid oxygenase family protein [Acinetobacter sp.]|uniref:carotenoid oxygenase family protein n=1 Tax=Acinetobacter sp. TaxID=472 RepID=UPI0030156E05
MYKDIFEPEPEHHNAQYFKISECTEGEGYLLSYVHHIHKESSKVVILKAQGLMLQPQAEIILGVHVPLGFHGNWVDLS